MEDTCTILEEDDMYSWEDGIEEWEGSTGGKINDGNVHEIKFEVR